MATKLYLHDAANALSGTFPAGEQSASAANTTWTGANTLRTMNTTIGTAQVAPTGATGGSTATRNIFMRFFCSDTLNVNQTVGGGTLTANFADAETSLQANFSANNVVVYVWRPSDGTVVGYLTDTLSTTSLEPTTINSEQVSTFTRTTSSVSALAGDVIIAEVWWRGSQGNNNPYTGTLYYDGTTENATENAVVSNHASYIELAETLTFGTPPSGSTGAAAAAGTATGVGAATAAAVGTAAAAGAATGVGAATAAAVGAAAATGTATGVGAATAAAVGAAAATGTATATALAAGNVGAAAGAGAATGVGAATAAATGAAAATGTATGVGAATAAAVGTAAGTGSATAAAGAKPLTYVAPVAGKRHRNNVALCYHGCVTTRAEMKTFREYLADLRSQVVAMEAEGYTFVSPTQYKAWRDEAYTPAGPIATLHFDDGLASILEITPWLIARGTPFGLALIGRRQRKHVPETDFLSWAQIKTLVDSGLCELLSHTFNHHNLALIGATAEAGPVLEGPCWVDDGEVLYRAAGDPRFYWDYSLIDTGTWGFPLFGTDPFDGVTPITSTVTFTPTVTQTVTTLRLFAALHAPSGAGYSCQVRIKAGAVVLGTVTVGPKQYETRAQWVEREFQTIVLPTSFAAVSGTPVTLTFETLTVGSGVFRIYAVPEPGGSYSMTTTARSNSLGVLGSLYQDYPANVAWPARAGIILTPGTGAVVSSATYQGYVEDDATAQDTAFDTWLNATWTVWPLPYVEEDPLYAIALYGTHADGVLADTKLKYVAPASFTAEVLRVKNTSIASATAELRYAAVVDIHIGTSATGPWTKVARWVATWSEYKVVEIDIAPFNMVAAATYWIRFQTLNASPWGNMVQRILLDQDGPTAPETWFVMDDVWSDGYETPLSGHGAPFLDVLSKTTGAAVTTQQIVYPFGAYYDIGTGGVEADQLLDARPELKSVLAGKGITHGYTIWPTRNDVDSAFREPGLRVTDYALGRVLMYGDIGLVTKEDNTASVAGYLWPDAQHRGVLWQTSLEPDPLGNATVKHAAAALDFVAFDAWFFKTDGTIQKGKLNDGGTYCELVSRVGSFLPGETITGGTSGATATIVWALNDPTHDQLRVTPSSGTFVLNETITGGTSGATAVLDQVPTLYADDRTWLRSRGVRCLLIVSNYNHAIGDVDPSVAAAVFGNYTAYTAALVAEAAAWGGITINMEAVPAGSRAAATAAITAWAQAIQATGKLCHMTAPGKTGTAYDDPAWTDWCDHAELVRHVNAMKIMTYTESGEFGPAAPHAPDTFFKDVYNYTQTTVNARYWPRILVGCNTFGHLWGDPGGTRYITYHEGYAEGLLRGATTTHTDGEAHWTKTVAAGTTEAWFGDPLTVDRAAESAWCRGLGGVGLWKADDGDMWEHFPQWPQLGLADARECNDPYVAPTQLCAEVPTPRTALGVVCPAPVQVGRVPASETTWDGGATTWDAGATRWDLILGS